jgi:manganese/iron transport system permease protein
VPGVAGAYMLGLPFALGAFFSGGLAATTMLFLQQKSKLKVDAIIGLIFTSFNFQDIFGKLIFTFLNF